MFFFGRIIKKDSELVVILFFFFDEDFDKEVKKDVSELVVKKEKDKVDIFFIDFVDREL